MFARAYEITSEFTAPVIISTRFFDDTVACGVAALTILNKEGWAITTAHNFDVCFAHQQHSKELLSFKQQVETIEDNSNWDTKRKRKQKSRLVSNPKWITNYSHWWGCDGIKAAEVKILREADLALVKLEPYQADYISCYPTLKNPATMKNGTSLCKLGFPFHQISASFDETTQGFTLAPGSLPVPRFPIEGIYTRCVSAGCIKDKYDVKFIETSTPGLQGQSGGPVFDVDGLVWGIQCRTVHLPLGFSPKINHNGREVEENQFLNIGWAIHSELLIAFLSDNNVKFSLSKD